VWDALPGYADWGFAVFKLRSGRAQSVHPMAFVFPRRDPRTLFFPTVHVHDGTVPAEATFDHSLYAQPERLVAATFGWERSDGDVGRFLDPGVASVVDLAAPAYRRHRVGRFANADLTLTAPPISDPDALEVNGRRFHLRLAVTAAYLPVDVTGEHAAWRRIALTRHHALGKVLADALGSLTGRLGAAWDLVDYDPSLPLVSSYFPFPQVEGPVRRTFHPGSSKVEPQAVTLAFARFPAVDRIHEIDGALRSVLAGPPVHRAAFSSELATSWQPTLPSCG
jgi:hypothetical protein